MNSRDLSMQQLQALRTGSEATGPATQAPRPRVLLADGGRISRGALGDTLRLNYDVREVADREAAWQAVLLDPAIRVVIADVALGSPYGYELLTRMRSSKVQRIRETPAIALTEPGRDADGQRAAALDATELAVKATENLEQLAEQLVARLRVLVDLANTRDALAQSRTELESARTVDPETDLYTLATFDKQVEKLISYARRALSDLALICIRVELRMPHNEAWVGEIEQRMKLVGRALSSSIRLEDLATRSDRTEFCVATQNNGMTDMLQFAARLRKVLENVDAAGSGVEVWTSIGVAALSEELRLSAAALRAQAQRRAEIAQSTRSRRIILGGTDANRATSAAPGAQGSSMDIGLALALINNGRGAEVIPHLPRILQQLNPLLRFIREHHMRSAGSLPAEERDADHG